MIPMGSAMLGKSVGHDVILRRRDSLVLGSWHSCVLVISRGGGLRLETALERWTVAKMQTPFDVCMRAEGLMLSCKILKCNLISVS